MLPHSTKLYGIFRNLIYAYTEFFVFDLRKLLIKTLPVLLFMNKNKFIFVKK